MTALDFPTSPVDGQTYSNYIYDGTKAVWRLQPNIPNINSKFYVSDTAPADPQNGEIWLNSTDGNTYIYYVDGDSSQWVEIGGNTGQPPTIDDLNDVTITSPSDGQALVYDSASGDWVNETPASTVDSLTDTTITTPSSGESLVYNGSAWVNEATVINTDGDPGTKIYVGATDPSGSYTLTAGDIWIEV